MSEKGTETIKREKEIAKITLIGSAVNLFLIFIKLLAGFIGNSAAIIADGIHSLSDFLTDIIVLVFVRISGKPKDKDHDYGHGKYETLATALVGVSLLAVGFYLFFDNAQRIFRFFSGEELHSPGLIALFVAVVSVVSKELLFRFTRKVGMKYDSTAVIANAWHHRSDALSSIGASLGIAGAILLGEKFAILDPIAALLVSFFIVRVALKQLLLPCIDDLLEKSLPEEIEKEIEDIVLLFDGVSNPHNMRTRRIGNHFAIEVHIRMNGDLPLSRAHQTATEIEEKLKERFGPETHVAIHVEPEK
ncbi:MAG: cation transporter [Paludibacteraceae bacterium]|nr:cation transporter [Paludibacteraceae bacterium]